MMTLELFVRTRFEQQISGKLLAIVESDFEVLFLEIYCSNQQNERSIYLFYHQRAYQEHRVLEIFSVFLLHHWVLNCTSGHLFAHHFSANR